MADVAVERTEARALPLGNPAPLGLCGFALTTFVLSSVNAGFIVPSSGAGQNVVVGLAIFYGGIAQILAGMWEFRAGNTFGATAFTSYGAFWLSFGAILIPGSGILDALVKTPASVHPALGLFLLGWTIFTGLMLLGALRSNLALIAVFLVLFLTFLSLTIGELSGGAAGNTWQVLGGWLGIITALVAWYTALAGVLASTRSAFKLPTFPV